MSRVQSQGEVQQTFQMTLLKGVMGLLPRTLTGLFLFALVLRLAFVGHHVSMGFQLRFDPSYYLTLAANIEHGVYSLFHPMNVPDTTRMPGYPFLIHLMGNSILIVLLVQAVLSALKVILVHRTALLVGMDGALAIVAALLMAVEPMDVLLSGQLLSESCFTFLLLLGCYLLMRDTTWKDPILAGISFAGAVWFRPNGLLIALAGCVLMVVVLHKDVRRIALCSAITLLLVLPWVLRNKHVTGRAILSDGGAVAAAYFHVPKVLALQDEGAAVAYHEMLSDRSSRVDWENKDEVAQFMGSLRDEVRKVWADHPFRAAQVLVTTSVKVLLAPGRGHICSFLGAPQFLGDLVLGWSAILSGAITLSLLGFVLLFRTMPSSAWMFVAFSMVVLLTSGISTADARFKNPAMPFLLLLLAQVVGQCRNRMRANDPGTV